MWSLMFTLYCGQHNARRLGHNGAMIGNIPCYHSPCAYLYASPHPNTAHQDSSSANPAVRPDMRRSSGHLADGNILINPAVFSDFGILRNKDSMQAMRKCRTTANERTRSDVSTMAAGTSEKQKA